jgi:hypothetical protein
MQAARETVAENEEDDPSHMTVNYRTNRLQQFAENFD